MSIQNVKKLQSSGELNLPKGFQGPRPNLETDRSEGPLTISSVYLFFRIESVIDGRG